jgi:sulfur carrier protein ThiS
VTHSPCGKAPENCWRALQHMIGQALISLEGSLAQFTKTEQPVSVAAGQTIYQAAVSLGIPATRSFSILVNGQVVDSAYLLEDGDFARLIPQISGGL